MNDQDPPGTFVETSHAERLDAYLEACDDALAAGAPPETLLVGTAPPDLRDDLERRAAFLRKLQQLRPTRAARDVAAPSPLPWRWLGRFQLHRELGRGGFGIVYLASDSVLDRLVALKVPRAELADGQVSRERFEREARAVAGLEHANVVPVYEAGQVGPVSFLVSAFCPGPTLSAWLRERTEPLALIHAATLLQQLAEGVEHAHSRGVLHRDLKPGNILMQPVAAKGPTSDDALAVVPRITDFGLARLVETSAGGTEPLTATGTIMGTAEYMAPEQAAGKNRAVGQAADVYSLGVILYELLTGRTPFRGETALETLMMVQHEEPLPPVRLRPRVPRNLETICLRCLQKEPTKRYASAHDLATDLGHFLRGEPIQARPVGTGEKLWRWCRRKPALASLAAALIVVITSSLVVLALLWRQSEDRRILAESNAIQAANNAVKFDNERQRAEDNLDQARKAVREHFVELSKIKLDDASDPKELRKKQLEAALKYFQDFLSQRSTDPDMQLEVVDALYRVGRITAEIGSSVDALAIFEEARTLQERLLQSDPNNADHRLALAAILNDLGILHNARGDPGTAQRFQDQARAIRETLAAEKPEVAPVQLALAESWYNLGNTHLARQEMAAALDAFSKARALQEKLLQGNPDYPVYQGALALACHGQGHVYRITGEKEAALRCYHEARGLQEKLLQRYPARAEAQAYLAMTCHSLGLLCANQFKDSAAAIRHYEEACALQEKLVQTHPAGTTYQVELARTCMNLGYSQRAAKNPSAARRSLGQARTLQEKLVQEHPTVPQYQLELAHAFKGLAGLDKDVGDLDAAVRNYAEARAIIENLVRKHPGQADYRSTLGGTLNDLGLVLEKTSRFEEALATYEQAIDHQRFALGKAPRVHQYRQYLANHHLNRARLLAEQARLAEASAQLEECAKLRPNQPDDRVSIACVFAKLVAAVGRDKTELTTTERAEQETYAARALEFLRQAQALGYKDVNHLRTEPDLKPLHDRADFQQLMSEMAKN